MAGRSPILAEVFYAYEGHPSLCVCAVLPWHYWTVHVTVHSPSWRFGCQLWGNVANGSPFLWWPCTQAPRQHCRDAPDRAKPLPRGNTFKLSNCQLAHAVPWHISLERKVTGLVSRNLFLSVIASEGFFFFLRKRPITFSKNCKGKTALSLFSYKS